MNEKCKNGVEYDDFKSYGLKCRDEDSYEFLMRTSRCRRFEAVTKDFLNEFYAEQQRIGNILHGKLSIRFHIDVSSNEW